MKVRWTDQSVRLRITPAELIALSQNKIVKAALGPKTGGWSARIVPGCARTDLKISDGALCINLALHDLEDLSSEDSEGVYFEPDDFNKVRFYIEKDFACAHPRASEAAEPQTETFAAPCNPVNQSEAIS